MKIYFSVMFYKLEHLFILFLLNNQVLQVNPNVEIDHVERKVPKYECVCLFLSQCRNIYISSMVTSVHF